MKNKFRIIIFALFVLLLLSSCVAYATYIHAPAWKFYTLLGLLFLDIVILSFFSWNIKKSAAKKETGIISQIENLRVKEPDKQVEAPRTVYIGALSRYIEMMNAYQGIILAFAIAVGMLGFIMIYVGVFAKSRNDYAISIGIFLDFIMVILYYIITQQMKRNYEYGEKIAREIRHHH